MKDELRIALIQSDISWLDPEANFASFADHMLKPLPRVLPQRI